MILDTDVQWPETPEERKTIPDYGDFVSTIIWYPVRLFGAIMCNNCLRSIESHDIPGTGGCSVSTKL